MIVPHMPVWPAAHSWGLSPAKRDEDPVVFFILFLLGILVRLSCVAQQNTTDSECTSLLPTSLSTSPPARLPLTPHLTFLTFALSSSSFSLLCQLQTSLFSSKGNSQWEERVAVLEQWLLIKLPSVWKWPSRCWVSWFALRTWTLNS